MKTINILCATLLLFTSAYGETTFVEAGRFIHLREVEDGEQEDIYVRAEAIDEVVISRSQDEDDKKLQFKVEITTRIFTSSKKSHPEAWCTNNRSYEVDCASREEAEKIAATIVMASLGDQQGNEAEAAPRQPATRPLSK